MSKNEQRKITESTVKKLSDKELDKVAGGAGSPCGNPLCRFYDNKCHCPNDGDLD